MSAKNRRRNVAAEARLLEHSPVEERAMEIAQQEGRDVPTEDDRSRAREELLAPNQRPTDPEVSPELGEEITSWDDAPESHGHKVEDRIPEDEDESSVGQDLIENGMRGPRHSKDPNRQVHP